MVTRGAFSLSRLIFSVSSSRVKRQIRVVTERAVIASRRSDTAESFSDRGVRRWTVGLTSLFFIVLQSACALVMALSGVRLVIGLGTLAAVAAGAKGPATGFHQDAIRIPMMVLAVLGSCINLYMIWRIRSLRKRPSSMEAAAGLRPAPLGRKSADHPRCCHSYFGRGRIALPPLHLPLGRIEKIRIIEYRIGLPGYWR
jgi:hypothetical protein